MSETPRRLCVCVPGSNFSAIWMMEWSGLLLHLASRFFLRLAGGEGNNIYLVRENCLKQAMGDPNGLPELILWIDSDNPPSVKGFELLLAAIDASPEVSIVGGWYRFCNPFTKQVYVAAGKRHTNVTEQEMLESDHLVEVDFIGFGFCLMRRQVIDDIGLDNCFEPVLYRQHPITAPEWKEGMRTWSTDDDGFGIKAQHAGHRIFVHPGVFSHHEKRLNVPGSFENNNEEPVLKEA